MSTPFASVAEKETFEQVKSSKAPLPLELFFLPLAMTVPDMLHCLFNGFQESCEELPGWTDFHTRLKALCVFFKQKALVERFLVTCAARAFTIE